MKTKNPFATLGFISLSVGIAIGIGVWFGYRSTQTFVEHAEIAPGTVTDLVRQSSSGVGSGYRLTYRPVVEFRTFSGRLIEFTSSIGTNPPSHQIGETVEVLYAREDPYDARLGDSWSLSFFSFLGAAIGSLFFVLGAGTLMVISLGGRRRAYLLKHGIAVQTEFKSVHECTNISFGSRHPFRIVSHWKNPTTGELHVFRSQLLWFDPSPYLKDDLIPVHIEINKLTSM